jgi:hypothetical protein
MTSGKYFNKGVKALDAADIGHVVRETPVVKIPGARLIAT